MSIPYKTSDRSHSGTRDVGFQILISDCFHSNTPTILHDLMINYEFRESSLHYYRLLLFRGEITPLSLSYNIPGLVPGGVYVYYSV